MIEALLQAERLLVHGMVDQAEQIYAGALAQDPHNAIAVVGLARVALERGDEQLAYARARQALEIDPQNAAAQRLEARLAEVFAARGTPPAPETRNPSMSDHLATQERRQTPHASPPDNRSVPEHPETAERRTGLWRRILGE